MPELHITRGLPASGKTTYAEAWVLEDPANRARVNRDSFRRMMHVDVKHVTQHTEALITKLAHDAARSYLRAGVSVIVDDTNLRQRTARDWATLAKVTGAELVVDDFTDVPMGECLGRNAARAYRVPDSVIEGMHARYLAGKSLPLPIPEPLDGTAESEWEPVERTPGLPDALLVDIDGTVAKCGDRDIYDAARAHLDTPHHDVIALIHRAAAQTHHIIFMTGRDEQHRAVTDAWLRRHAWTIYRGELHMRPTGDKRKDSVVKHELFNEHVRGRYNITAAFDDRDQVVRLWRDMGIRTYQVADGDF